MKIKEYRVVHDKEMHPQLEVAHEYVYNGDYKSYEGMVNILNSLFKMNVVAEEYLYVIAQNYNLDILGIYQLSHGNFKETRADNRELFIFLLLVGAERFVIAHNHPNGSLVKSDGDINTTKRIKEFAWTLGIDFDEHFIISKNGYSQFIHELPENKVSVWDGESCEELEYLVTDSFAIKLHQMILKFQEKENRDLGNYNKLSLCDEEFWLADDEYDAILDLLKNAKESEVFLCRED